MKRKNRKKWYFREYSIFITEIQKGFMTLERIYFKLFDQSMRGALRPVRDLIEPQFRDRPYHDIRFPNSNYYYVREISLVTLYALNRTYKWWV